MYTVLFHTLLTIRNISVRFNHHLELITSWRLHKRRNVRKNLTMRSVHVTLLLWIKQLVFNIMSVPT